VKAIGFSDTRPLVEGDGAAALASNRRVDIIIESNEEEQVRALIRSVAAASHAP
jgi:chemotaxis protein MotB